jgi:hypothetical protein
MARLPCLVLAATGCSVGASPPADYDVVRSWRGTITVTVDDTEAAAGIATRMTGSLEAAFGPLALDPAVSTSGTPVWTGRNLHGRMAVASTAQDPAASSQMAWSGAGELARDAEIRLAIDRSAGTYELHLYTGAVAGTYTSEVMGQRETRPDRVSIGGMTRRFTLPAAVGRIEEHFQCSFAECYVHGIPASPDKRAIRVAIVLEPIATGAAPGWPGRDTLAVVGGVGLAALSRRRRRR